jgi:choline transporter-like protein 2/4/5
MDQKIAALSKSWTIILASVPIAIVLSILFMLIMRFTAGIFVYLLFAIAILGLLLFGIFLIAPSESNYLGIQENRTVSIIIGVVCVVLALLILLAFCCFRKRVKLAAIVVKLSARFVNENCLMLILPLILFVCMVVFLILWILEALGFYSMGEPKHEPYQLPFQHF